MTSKLSSIIDFYPENFDTDLNGKQQEYEAVVLLPFIEEDKLKEAMVPYKNLLTEEEKSSKFASRIIKFKLFYIHAFPRKLPWTNANLCVYKGRPRTVPFNSILSCYFQKQSKKS